MNRFIAISVVLVGVLVPTAAVAGSPWLLEQDTTVIQFDFRSEFADREFLPDGSNQRFPLRGRFQAQSLGFNFRYGLGLDLYYAFVLADIDPQRAGGAPLRRGLAFEGDLGDEVPPLVQPLGFAVFGLVAVVALALVAAVLRGLRLAEL